MIGRLPKGIAFFILLVHVTSVSGADDDAPSLRVQLEMTQATARKHLAELTENRKELAAAWKLIDTVREQNAELKKLVEELKKQIGILRTEVERLKKDGLFDASDDKGAIAATKTVVRAGDVEIKSLGAKIGRIACVHKVTEKSDVTEERMLTITVQISNLSSTRKIDYRTWGSDSTRIIQEGCATLKDEHGNKYKRITFGLFRLPVGRTESETIYPGKSVTDILIFEEPVDKAKHLTVTLPLENVGGAGFADLELNRK